MANERYYDDLALLDSHFDGKAFSGCAVGLNTNGDSGQYLEIEVADGEFYTYWDANLQVHKTFNHLGVEQ